MEVESIIKVLVVPASFPLDLEFYSTVNSSILLTLVSCLKVLSEILLCTF